MQNAPNSGPLNIYLIGPFINEKPQTSLMEGAEFSYLTTRSNKITSKVWISIVELCVDIATLKVKMNSMNCI